MAKPYYVYQLIDPRTGAPFYVGKGQKRRAWSHLGGKSHSHAVNKRASEIEAAGHKVLVQILERFESSAEAVEYEATIICASTGLLNVLSRGWALTPELERIRRMAAADKESIRLAKIHGSKLRKRVAEFDKFERFGLLDLPEEIATKIVGDVIASARELLARWDALEASAT